VNFDRNGLYWVEAHYIASDDASSGNGLNNASYHQVTLGEAPTYALTKIGPFFEQRPAIFAWQAQDPRVSVVIVDVPGPIVERFHVARKVTPAFGNLWHYEYVVHNMSSDHGARSFSVKFPKKTNILNVGFKDIEHHSGEPYAVNDWKVTRSDTTLTWTTQTFKNGSSAESVGEKAFGKTEGPPYRGCGSWRPLPPLSPPSRSFLENALQPDPRVFHRSPQPPRRRLREAEKERRETACSLSLCPSAGLPPRIGSGDGERPGMGWDVG
jgi:hypothetical protein